jgi:hypothetical protein
MPSRGKKMKKSILTATLITAGIVAGANAAEQFLGDGVANPITQTGTATLDLTTANLLDVNDGTGTYGTWVNGNDLNIVAGAPKVTVTDAVTVNNITRSAGQSGRADYFTTGSGLLTINGTISGSTTRQANFGGANSAANAMSWGGNLTMGTGVNRLLLTSVQTIAAGSSVTASAGNVLRLASSESTDFSNLAINLNGGTFQNWNLATAVTLGSLTGNGSIDINGAQTTSINAINVGDASTIGLLSGDMAVTMGSGTHNFDLLSLSGVNTADKLAGASTVLGGDLVVDLLAGSDVLENGDSFDLFDGTLSGSFNSVTLTSLGGGLSWDTSALETTGTITVIPEPATLGLVAAMGGSILFIRRRFMI